MPCVEKARKKKTEVSRVLPLSHWFKATENKKRAMYSLTAKNQNKN